MGSIWGSSPEDVDFTIKEGRGMLCQSITKERAKELELELMVETNTATHQTPFTVTIDYLYGTTTGVSAFDRAKTTRAVADEKTKPNGTDHIFSLIANSGGVLDRKGHTEAATDLARLAELFP